MTQHIECQTADGEGVLIIARSREIVTHAASGERLTVQGFDEYFFFDELLGFEREVDTLPNDQFRIPAGGRWPIPMIVSKVG